MNNIGSRVVSFLLFVLLCASATYWFVHLTAKSDDSEAPAPPVRAPLVMSEAGTLFGGRPAVTAQDVHLAGVLRLGTDQGAAAIVAVGESPARAIAVGQRVDPDTRLREVRARSIIVERNGQTSEVFLPANNGSAATVYVR